MTIDKYPIEKRLGSLVDKIPNPTGDLGIGPLEGSSYQIDIVVSKILSVRDIFKIDNQFKIDPEIMTEISQNYDFYRVTVVSDFMHGNNLKFVEGWINIELVSNSSNVIISSASPPNIDEEKKVTRDFTLDPKINIVEKAEVSPLLLS